MGTYKIVYRDAAGHDRKAFTSFEDSATIEENLARIVPRAIEKGLLHPEATAQNVLVEHKGIRLNLKLPIKQAAPSIKDHDDIVVRYLASQINLRMRIKADDPGEQRKIIFGKRKTLSIEESVGVSPSEPLIDQIEDKLSEISKKHKFYGKRVSDVKKFKLRIPDKKINPMMSLAEQGFETDVEVDVRPRVWFDWPPCFYHGFRGPYTGYAITLGILVPLVILFLWVFAKNEVPRFQVTFEAPFECNIKVSDSDEFVRFDEGKAVLSMAAGLHTIHVYPRERPIQEHSLLLERKVRGGISERDSTWIEPLVLAAVDTVAADSLLADSVAVRKATMVTVVGYEGASSMANLRVPLLFNGFEYSLKDELSWHFELIPGEYEFKLQLGDDLFISSDPGEGGVTKKSDFVFVVSDTTETTIKFRYATGGDQ
jgi:hypothetical protein